MGRNTDKPTPLTDADILKLLRETINLFKKRVEDKSVPVSVSDLTRLLEKESEVAGRSVARKVTVSWVDPAEWEKEQADEDLVA